MYLEEEIHNEHNNNLNLNDDEVENDEEISEKDQLIKKKCFFFIFPF
jgi:hypothetical protein